MPTKVQIKKKETHDLGDLFAIQLRGLYDIETHLAKALPKITKKGTSPVLKEALEQYCAQIEDHVRRLEDLFEVLHVKAQKLPSAAIRGLVEDADWVAKNVYGSAAIDVGLVSALQAIQHYKVALYSTAFEWAKLLEHQEVIDILEETMHDADEGLEMFDELAGSKLNEEALAGERADSDDESEESSDDEEEAEEEGDDEG